MAAKRPKKGTVIGANSPEMDAADKEEGSFKKGGMVKRKRGGKIDGDATDYRLDKRARGGSLKSPYSAAKSLSAPTSKARAGHEGEYVD